MTPVGLQAAPWRGLKTPPYVNYTDNALASSASLSSADSAARSRTTSPITTVPGSRVCVSSTPRSSSARVVTNVAASAVAALSRTAAGVDGFQPRVEQQARDRFDSAQPHQHDDRRALWRQALEDRPVRLLRVAGDDDEP